MNNILLTGSFWPTENGDVYVWGSNIDKQLGLDSINGSVFYRVPTIVPIFQPIGHVSCGHSHTAFVTSKYIWSNVIYLFVPYSFPSFLFSTIWVRPLLSYTFTEHAVPILSIYITFYIIIDAFNNFSSPYPPLSTSICKTALIEVPVSSYNISCSIIIPLVYLYKHSHISTEPWVYGPSYGVELRIMQNFELLLHMHPKNSK